MAQNPLPLLALAAGAFFLLRRGDDEGKEPLVIKPKPKDADKPADDAGEDPDTPPPGDPSQPEGTNESVGQSGQQGDVRWAVYYTEDTSGWPPQTVEGWVWRAWQGTPRYSDSNWSFGGMENSKAAALAAAQQATSQLVALDENLIEAVEEDLATIVSGNYAKQNFGLPLRVVERSRDQGPAPARFTVGVDIYEDEVTDESGQFLGMVKWADATRPDGLSTWWTRSIGSAQNASREARLQNLRDALEATVAPYRK